MNKKENCVPAGLLIALSLIASIFWLIMLFFTLFMGGSPGPDYGRTVPLMYAGIIALGWIGSVMSLITGILSLRKNSPKKVLPICAALLGILGGVPFLLLGLTAMWLFALLPGLLPPLVYLLLARNSSKPNV